VRFMVDTGASSVALSAHQADALGVPYRDETRAGRVQTAAGVVKGYRVTLPEVRVGAVRLAQVEATVLDGPDPPQALLGMSFLRRTRMRSEPGALVLESIGP
jgi:aspartyl protease family protein